LHKKSSKHKGQKTSLLLAPEIYKKPKTWGGKPEKARKNPTPATYLLRQKGGTQMGCTNNAEKLEKHESEGANRRNQFF